MAEVLQVAVGKDALGGVALQLRDSARIDSCDQRALRRERLRAVRELLGPTRTVLRRTWAPAYFNAEKS